MVNLMRQLEQVVPFMLKVIPTWISYEMREFLQNFDLETISERKLRTYGGCSYPVFKIQFQAYLGEFFLFL